LSIFRNPAQKNQVSFKSAEITVTLHEDRYTFLILCLKRKLWRKLTHILYQFFLLLRKSCRFR